MAKINASIFLDGYLGKLRHYLDLVDRRCEAAALLATDEAARSATRTIRTAMQGARLGKLGNAIGQTSDLSRKATVHRRAQGFSASGLVVVRSRSPRTVGAVEAYTQGANIRPVRGRWLWIPTDEAPKRIRGKAATPEAYIAAGSPLGKLITIKGVNGRPLLAVENVGKSAVGARGGRVRTLKKKGGLRKGDRARALAVLFVAIPATSRAARIDVTAAMRAEQAKLPERFERAVKRTREA